MNIINKLTAALAIALALALGSLAVDRNFIGFSLAPNYPALVQKLGPSVVFISVYQRNSPVAELEEVNKLLKGFESDGLEEDEEELTAKGVGSGFIWSADGYIITNAHVVKDADQVRVTTADGAEYIAEVKGSDARSDVAVLKINAINITPVAIGSSDDTMVGESVLAIGSPFGLTKTVTVGVVSAKGRETGDYIPAIQTDVAINPGNSGGPLINKWGQVIAINSAIYSQSGGYQGIAFAIPIDDAVKVAEQLKLNGKVVRGYLGVNAVPVSKKFAEKIGLDRAEGLQVSNIAENTPAAESGLKIDDVIISVDGIATNQVEKLVRYIGNSAPGTQVKIKVYRDKAYIDLIVTLVENNIDYKK